MTRIRHILIVALTTVLTNGLLSQSQPKPTAKFSFNDGKDYNEVSYKKAELIGVNFVPDRFDNENSAIYLHGNEYSYINLGCDNSLKPKAGTISLWLKMDTKIWSGTGSLYNPIILTKSNRLDDFYEAYAIYYLLEPQRLVAVSCKDSTKAVGISALKNHNRNQWHHLVISYDNNYFWFYIDGILEVKLPKNFETKFLYKDPVIVGATGNKKNNRWLNGIVDDIEFFDHVLSSEEVKDLYHAPNPNNNKIILNWILISSGILLVIILLFFIIKNRIKKAVEKERLRLELNNKLLETELRVNRASMNPHFLFNSLNALHNLIISNDIENASDYLIKFSKMIRKILDSNMHESISLELEIELLERYLEIENLRFEENISYSIIIDESVIASIIYIPIMMLQPFVENAIWHGLLNKQGEKTVTISFSLFDQKYIYCTIEDNGKGRRKGEPDVLEKKSLATGFILQRLDLLNKIHNLKCSLLIEDKENNSGTIVKIILPILDK